MPSHILVVDDQSNVRATIAYLLEKEGFKVAKAASGDEALKLLEEREFDVAIIDLKMAQMTGLELLGRVRARWPGVAVILMTAYASIPSAVDAMKMGASHYLEKPFTKETLLEVIAKAQEEYGRAGGDRGSPFSQLVGASPEFADALELARKAATHDKPVLILGELGTGRETLARAIHASSGRSHGPFVPVRCAASSTLEAELFGTSSGPPGRLVEANGGTLYLDEAAELTPDLQAKLLRYLQDGEFVRGPAVPPVRADARVIASSSADLEAMVQQNEFRQDVFLRLRSVLLRLPPLRERRGDLSKLLAEYAKKHKPRGGAPVKFSREAVRALAAHPFPGNLKELEGLVEQVIAICPTGEVEPEHLAKLGIEIEEPVEPEAGAMRSRVELEEKKAIEEALKRNPRNLAQAAKELKISRTTLWRKMRKYDLTVK